MLKNKDMQLSIYSVLYNKIPENHTLKLIKDHVDFSFINELLEDSYSKYYGRPAKEPELMVKLLVLQYLYNLSDVRLIEEASLNLAHMYFLGINPDEDLPHPSLLAKFRTQRLQEVSLDEIIVGIVKQCVDKGIIKDTSVSVDATHSTANTFKATIERVMKRLAKKLFKTLEKEQGEIPSEVNQEIPDYTKIEDHVKAKAMMKTYLEETVKAIEAKVTLSDHPKTRKVIENIKEILEDPKFIQQKGVRSIVDQDARVGHKSKTSSFLGYKTEFIMTTDERIITAVKVNHGAYIDGTQFDELMDLTVKTGLSIEEVYGDKAYFKKAILDAITGLEATPYIPVSGSAYKINEELFSYNKDSDEWSCAQGNHTIRKKAYQDSRGYNNFKYYFEREQCRNCPLREMCMGKSKNVARIMNVSVNTPEFYGYSQEQKSEAFKEKYKKRAAHEWKNGEMKCFHGLDRARGYGLKSMSTQAKLTAIAVNLKRIASIISSSKVNSGSISDGFYKTEKISRYLIVNRLNIGFSVFKTGVFQWSRTGPLCSGATYMQISIRYYTVSLSPCVPMCP